MKITKYICDRCGREVKENTLRNFTMPVFFEATGSLSPEDVIILRHQAKVKEICRECHEEYNELHFNAMRELARKYYLTTEDVVNELLKDNDTKE